MLGPSRRARPSTLTMYMGNDGFGVVSFGGEEVVGSDIIINFWAAGVVGAAGTFSAVGIGGAS
jgi:hypothetical protein